MAGKQPQVIIPEQYRSVVTKYILHFNIDHTLIIPESIKNHREDELIQILIHYAWGKLDEKNKYKLTQNVFTLVPKDPESISYFNYMETIFPLSENPEENVQIKKNRYEANINFIKTGLGAKLRPDLDKILKSLQIPKVIQDELFALSQAIKSSEAEASEITESQRTILSIFQSGFIFILPILYKTFINLKKAKKVKYLLKEFSVVFRSNNKANLEKFVAEFNLFCTGEHPQYNGKNNYPQFKLDGIKNQKNYIIYPPQYLSLYQTQGKQLDLQGVFGKLERTTEPLSQVYQKDINNETVHVEEGEKIYVRMLNVFKEFCSFAVLEENTELLVDPSDYNVLQLHFDGIRQRQIHVKDIITGRLVENPHRYLHQVSIIDLFKDQDLFIKQIQNAEIQRNEEIQNFEKTYTNGPDLNQPNDKELSAEEYLKQNILPLLHPAISLVEVDRPEDPISYIALYILKNKNQIKNTKKDNKLQQENMQDNQ